VACAKGVRDSRISTNPQSITFVKPILAMKDILPLCGLVALLVASCSDSTNQTSQAVSGVASPPAASPAAKAAPVPGAEVLVNGKALSAAQLADFKVRYKAEPKAGSYWYDPVSGLYGNAGQAAFGFMYPGHDFGTLAADASSGDTGVFVNRRQLPQSEWIVWSTVLGAAIQPGRYWLDAKGNAGYEGDPTPTVNLYVAAAQNAQSRAGGGARGGDNGWHTRFSSGNYNDDNSVGYVSVPGVGVIGSYGY